MQNNITKYMVIVETKNYPINIITPAIQRYARIRKRMNASEIASCLSCNAIVTLEKNDGTKTRLDKQNFKQVLVKYSNELATIEANKDLRKQEAINKENLEKLREDKKPQPAKAEGPFPVQTVEPVLENDKNEGLQIDPEDDDVFDSTPFYDDEE